MKKLIFTLTTISLLFLLALTACSSTDSNPGDVTQAGEGAGTSGEEVTAQEPGLNRTPNPDQERETPQAMQLVLGTFVLEKTDQAVDAEQATMLLPLWKAARSLSQSETVATEELQAVVNQIEDTMTPAQLDLIKDKQLSFEDMNSIADELGLELGFGGFGGEISPEMQATIQAARESGQAPPDGFGGPGGGFDGPPPGGGAGPGGGGEFGGFSPEQRQTAIAERGGFRQAGLGVPLPMLEAVIEFLDSKVQ